MLTKFWVKQFRNLQEIVVNIKKFNLVFGENNQGKTSVLEAIYFLSHAKSPLTYQVKDMINHDQEEAFLGIEFTHREQYQKIICRLNKNNKKIFQLDDKPFYKYSHFSNYLNVRYMSADTIQIFTQNPQNRRQAIDEWAGIDDGLFQENTSKYLQVLANRNQLIKEKRRFDEFKIWNQQLVELSDYIVQKRINSLISLKERIQFFLTEMDIEWANEFDISYDLFSLDSNLSYKDQLLDKLKNGYTKELAIGFSLYGAHKDDVILTIRNQLISKFYSRGINRIIALLFELALSLKKKQYSQIDPVLLCDDAFVELSQVLKEKVINSFQQYAQIIYATVLDSDQKLPYLSQRLDVKNGEITCII